MRPRAAARPGRRALWSFLKLLLTNAEQAWACARRLLVTPNDFPGDAPRAAQEDATASEPPRLAAAAPEAVGESTAPATTAVVALAQTVESCRMLKTCMRSER